MSKSSIGIAAAAVAVAAIAGGGLWSAGFLRGAPPQPPVPAVSVAPKPTPAAVQSPTKSAPAMGFDVVRVDPEGNAVIAGFAPRGQEILLRLDGDELARKPTDAMGKFVALMNVGFAETPRKLTLHSGDKTAPQEVIIAPNPRPDGTPNPEAAPTILLSDGAGQVALLTPTVPLVQTGESDTAVVSDLALDTISYGEEGAVELAGRSATAGIAQVYLDNAPVSRTNISDDGQWRLQLPEVDSGVYTLRVDHLDAAGKVVSRVETPFKRETAEVVANSAASAVTVQTGSTLWAIAQARYGDGTLYTRVFSANKGLIRDPNLIYPGQVFDLPN